MIKAHEKKRAYVIAVDRGESMGPHMDTVLKASKAIIEKIHNGLKH
jgi:hypothetical protein